MNIPKDKELKTEKLSTQQRILNATGELMCHHGYKGTTTKMIAEAAGVNEVTIFRYFKNKEGIILELIKEIDPSMTPVKDFLNQGFIDAEDLLTRFGAFLEEQLVLNKDILILSMREMGNEQSYLTTVFSKIVSTAVHLLGEKLRELYPAEKAKQFDFAAAAFMFINPLLTAFMVKNVLRAEIVPDLKYLIKSNIQILLHGLEGN